MNLVNQNIINDKEVTTEFLDGLAYPDFVGFINQWNVLPGSHVTLSKWIKFGDIAESSKLLQFACTTGFQSREIAARTGCQAKGFDLSPYAIWAAKYNHEHYDPEAKLEYFCADGHIYGAEEKYTHIAVGAGLKFFNDPAKTMKRCISLLENKGCLLASPFYVTKDIPSELIKKAEKVFGITPTTEGYKDVMELYEGLDVMYEDRNQLIPETEEELRAYCTATIDRACKIHNIGQQEVYDAMYQRLYDVKEMSNLLRPYQEYSVLVLRYREDIYPNRYVELF